LVGDDPDLRRPSSVRRRVAWASVVVVLVAAIVSSAALALRQQSDQEEHEEAEAQAAVDAVEDIIAGTTQALGEASALVDDDGTVTDDRFEAFAAAVASDSSVFAVAYSPLVSHADREDFELDNRLTIQDIDPTTARLTEAPARSRYAPALFFHPDNDDFQEFRGFDLLNDPTRGPVARETLATGERSLISVEIAATGAPGILLVQPVSDDGSDDVGFVTASYEISTLAEEVGVTLPDDAEIAIVGADGEVIVSSTDEPIDGGQATTEIAGLAFTAVVSDPDEDLWVAPLAVLLGGGLLALFLALVFGQSFRYERRIESAQQRTEELLELTSVLTRTLSTVEIGSAVLGRGGRLLGARGGVLAVVGEDGRRLRILNHAGLTEAGEAGLAGLTTAAALPEPVQRGEAIWLAAPSLRAGTDATSTSFATGATSAALVPLMDEHEFVGVIGWAFDEAARARGGARVLATSMAAQVAQALDRAERHDREHDLALELQRRLLPVDLPSIPSLPVAVRYRAAASGIVVGGDWYDAFELPDGSVAFVVGDVVGRGPQAAAVMVQLRSALKGYVSRDRDPAAALRSLHQVVPLVEDALCSTCCVVVADPSGGAITYARAGHPYPLVVGPDGFRYLRGGAGAPLGVVGGTGQTSASDVLRPGEHLLLYTDGAVERRGEHLDVGLDRLGRAAVAAFSATAEGTTDPDTFCDGLLERLFPDADPADDVALLAVARVRHSLRPDEPGTPAVEGVPAS
jgi:serine phosphatase RsbU (regulator of sigma subunit)